MSNPELSPLNQPILNPSNYDPQSESIHSKIMPIGVNDRILKQQENKIKSLKSTVQAYKANNETQNKKISSQDSLYVEYAIANKKYTELEKDFFRIQADNTHLTEALQSKTKLINEFQRLTEISSDKFRSFEKTNSELNRRLQIAEGLNESLTSINSIQKNKIRELETQSNDVKNDLIRKEESLNIKISSIEKKRSIDQQNHQKELIALTVENGRLKAEIEKLKHQIDDITIEYNDKERQYQTKVGIYENEIDSLKAKIVQYKHDLTDNQVSSKEINHDLNFKLNRNQNELKAKTDELNDKNGIIQQLNDCICEYNTVIKETENEIKQRDNAITITSAEKEKLQKELDEVKYALVEAQSKSKGTIDSLNMKINYNMDRLTNLAKDNEEFKKENKGLRHEIAKVKDEKRNLFDTVSSLEKKLKENMKLLLTKEADYSNQIKQYRSAICEKETLETTMRNKYEKKINMVSDAINMNS